MQVLQERAGGRNIGCKFVVVYEFSGIDIEREKTRCAEAVIAIVNRPQAIFPVNRDAEDFSQKMRLYCPVRVGNRCSVHPLQQLVTLGARFGMYGKEYPPVTADGDVSDRLRVAKIFFQLTSIKRCSSGQVRIGLAAAITHTQCYGRGDYQYQQE